MNILILKPLLLMLLILLPLNGYSEIIVDKHSKLKMDKSCLVNGQENLKISFPNLASEDAKYIAIYGCFCAYKESQKSLLPTEATDFRNPRNCIHYAVLRNSMRYKAMAGKNIAGADIKNSCLTSFPYDVTDDSKKEDVSSFCNCAASPTETLYTQIKPLKLNKEQIYEKLIKIINSCRYSI